jgi:hypothetical protein
MKALNDDVLRKIGRNVLVLQQIERLLKFLLTNHRADGTTTDFVERHQRRAEKIQTQTMGTLIKQYIGGILSDAGDHPNESEGDTQVRMSFTFRTTGDSDFYKSQRTNLELMVAERNNLIHNLLPQWQLDSHEQMTEASSCLDQQYEKVVPMLEHLKSVTKSMQQSVALLASDEFVRQFELTYLQHSPLITLLHEVATQEARPDGWTSLAHAAQLAGMRESDEVAHMEERYGHSTLKQLLAASELFDVLEPKGGSHTLYRVKKTLKH